MIKACTRHPEKAFALVNLPAVEVIQADMGASDIVEIIKPFNSASAFIVTPGDNENTAAIVGRAAQSCKAAGVQNVAVISDGFADVADSCIFGRQAKAVEQVIKETGISYTILRLPYFYENLQLKASVIRENSAIFSPSKADVAFTGMAVSDIGKAAAAILVNPSPHANKTYTLGSASHTFNDIVKAFSEALGREIKYVQQPYDEFEQTFVEMGWPDWLIQGVIEYFRLIDCGSGCLPSGVSTFKSITGQDPLTIQQWVALVSGDFK